MKIIESIKAIDTRNRRHIAEPLHTFKLTLDSDPIYSPTRFAREYAITATLGANQWIADELIRESGGAVIDQAVHHMKAAVVENLYGELRRDLINLSYYLRDELNYYDSASLQKLLKIIEKITL
jgi:hypothetical protein